MCLAPVIFRAELRTFSGFPVSPGSSNCYLLPHAEAQRLINFLSSHICRSTRRNFVLNPEIQLLAVLRFYAVGNFLEVVGDSSGLSKAAVPLSMTAMRPILLGHNLLLPICVITGS